MSGFASISRWKGMRLSNLFRATKDSTEQPLGSCLGWDHVSDYPIQEIKWGQCHYVINIKLRTFTFWASFSLLSVWRLVRFSEQLCLDSAFKWLFFFFSHLLIKINSQYGFDFFLPHFLFFKKINTDLNYS